MPPQVGASGCPHGVLPIGRHTHWRPEKTDAHSSPAAHVPLHAGTVSPQLGSGGPPSVVPLQSAGAAALAARNLPASSLTTLAALKRAQLRRPPVVTRMPTAPCVPASGSPAERDV